MDKFANYSSDSDDESEMRQSVKSEQSSDKGIVETEQVQPEDSNAAPKLALSNSSRTVSQEELDEYVEELPSELRDLGLDVNFCDDNFVVEEVEEKQEAVIAEVEMKEEAIDYK